MDGLFDQVAKSEDEAQKTVKNTLINLLESDKNKFVYAFLTLCYFLEVRFLIDMQIQKSQIAAEEKEAETELKFSSLCDSKIKTEHFQELFEFATEVSKQQIKLNALNSLLENEVFKKASLQFLIQFNTNSEFLSEHEFKTHLFRFVVPFDFQNSVELKNEQSSRNSYLKILLIKKALRNNSIKMNEEEITILLEVLCFYLLLIENEISLHKNQQLLIKKTISSERIDGEPKDFVNKPEKVEEMQENLIEMAESVIARQNFSFSIFVQLLNASESEMLKSNVYFSIKLMKAFSAVLKTSNIPNNSDLVTKLASFVFKSCENVIHEKSNSFAAQKLNSFSDLVNLITQFFDKLKTSDNKQNIEEIEQMLFEKTCEAYSESLNQKDFQNCALFFILILVVYRAIFRSFFKIKFA